jgi:hypothetical protein
MQLTKIPSIGIADGAVGAAQLAPGAGGGPRITQIQITDSSGTVLDDTAMGLGGGFIKITGTGFSAGAQVAVNNTLAVSTTFSSQTVLTAQVGAQTAGSYFVYVINADGGVAIAVNGLTYSGALYTFTDATFTTGGTTGREGPSLTVARSGLTGTGVEVWKNNTTFFNTTGGIQSWVVPTTGTYRIEAWGAQGGGGSDSRGALGGFGARMRGDFSLTSGEVIRILVGQTGSSTFGGGGGGTFVVRDPYNTTGSILLIAGGGSGITPFAGVSHATTATSGVSSSTANSGGTSGGGGVGGNGAAGGAGFTGNGGTTSCSGVIVPLAFVNGGTGGSGGTATASFGGFGGGSAADWGCWGMNGPGGGYSGGGAGSSVGNSGGGGSFNSGTNPSNDNGNTGTANLVGGGRVIITLI